MDVRKQLFNIKQKMNINTVKYKDRYPTVVLNVKSIEINDIDEDSPISFLRHQHKEISINNGSVKFVINKNLAGIVDYGKYRFWYVCDDPNRRYITLLMVERIE